MQRVYEENEWGKVSKIIVTAAFLWKPAPGNQLGTYFRIGKNSTQKAPRMPASEPPLMTTSTIEI